MTALLLATNQSQMLQKFKLYSPVAYRNTFAQKRTQTSVYLVASFVKYI